MSSFKKLQSVIDYAKLAASQPADEEHKMLQQGNTRLHLKPFEERAGSYGVMCLLVSSDPTSPIHFKKLFPTAHTTYLTQEQTLPLNL